AWAFGAAMLSMVIGVVVLLLWRPGSLADAADVLKDGTIVSVTSIISTAVQVTVLVLLARLAEWPPGRYLALVPPSGRETLIGLGCLALFLPAGDGLSYLLGKDIVTPFQIDTYRSARDDGSLALLWFTLVVAAPVGEEIMFRGFLFRGWVSER